MEALKRRYSDGLIEAANSVFETMIFMNPSRVEEFKEHSSGIEAEVIGVLGFTGTSSGVITLDSSKGLARTICANMLGMDESEVEGDEDIADSFGELVNMIGGNFKNLWVDDGNKMDLSIPTVVFGEGVSLSTGKACRSAYSSRIHFDTGEIDINLRFTD